LRNEISRLKILSANFKTQPQRLKFNRALALNLATYLKFGRARNLNFIARRKIRTQNRRTAKPACRADPAARLTRCKFYRFAAGQIPCRKANLARYRIKSTSQSKSAPQPSS